MFTLDLAAPRNPCHPPAMSLKLETIALHGGYPGDPCSRSAAVPLYRTSSFVFTSTEQAANLFALRELGSIYTRITNPTTEVLEKRVALLEGAPELGGLAVASGTSAVFYAIINLAKVGDNIVSARNLYGGTYTQFKDILPDLGIEVREKRGLVGLVQRELDRTYAQR